MAVSLSVKPGLEDPEALLWGPSFLTADPPGFFLDEDEEETLAEGAPSPFSSSSSSYADTFPSSPLSSLSPPSSPPSLLDCKAGADLLPWLSADELLDAHVRAADGKEDAFSGMDWMAEKMDLSEFDLESFMGSCNSDESPSSPDDLIASLESNMDLELDPLRLPSPDALLFHPSDPQELNIALPDLPNLPLPEPQAELEMKSEPPSPVPSPSLLPPPSPTFTLDLGSEVDVSESEKAQAPRIVLSLSPSKIVLLLAPKEEPVSSTIAGADGSASPSESGSDSGYVSSSPEHCPLSTPPPSPPTGSSRTKLYSTPTKPRPALEPPAMTGRVKSAADGGAPKVVEKKLKKMEQNKTAATRYRQKKRAEQEALSVECEALEQKNRELAEKAESISKEIQYLTDLIEEVRKARSRKTKTTS
ncbi:cyclic AMP-dependent transcription factor ATF-4-like [Megalops cyprinoides]|uniref:cyclic AMP-dependent transcription factor ATF-4-like n=1 Tax=Megalops cyprinoides TaxID=118141 RepID=UPI001864ECB5|nr:cyclic AMP-dependent transcription factor ATF-4-like [Megalops cyprinoides]